MRKRTQLKKWKVGGVKCKVYPKPIKPNPKPTKLKPNYPKPKAYQLPKPKIPKSQNQKLPKNPKPKPTNYPSPKSQYPFNPNPKKRKKEKKRRCLEPSLSPSNLFSSPSNLFFSRTSSRPAPCALRPEPRSPARPSLAPAPACALAPCSTPDVPPAPRSHAIITPAPALHRICINLAPALRQPSSAPNPLAACCAEPALLARLHSAPAIMPSAPSHAPASARYSTCQKIFIIID
ncbi:hypothetical protein SLEP1_g52279 [Rubroshorea leprosula]|uniref:Uncharacterized protein n=1 Tax=Rubroshorea leprosula TaxID=152421 RepID=A0AAV5M5T0_9ROSI|nr:hypothetical protein SLEP1_g52279 [Rubroshorea leprosula]